MTPKLTAGRRLRQDMDAALKRAGDAVGQSLEWDETEELMLVRAAWRHRAEELRTAYDLELAGEARAMALTKLSSEIRALDKQTVDLARSVHVGIGASKSARRQRRRSRGGSGPRTAAMARVAKSEINVAGVYRFLERQERAVRAVGAWAAQAHAERLRDGRVPPPAAPRGVAAGAPVNVHCGEILGRGAANDGVPVVSRPVGHQPQRAIVTPDDVITWSDDDWADLFLEESGLR